MRGFTISSLFVFNPTLKPAWPNPTEEDYSMCKLLYYYPENAIGYEQQSHIGLAEGLIMFVSQFTDQPLETIHTDKFIHVVMNCEPNIWLGIVFQFPEGTRDQDLVAQPHILKRITSNFYNNFYMFHGRIGSFSYPENIPTLRTLLSDYTGTFLYDMTTQDDPFEGFYYCPLDKKAYLQVQYQLNLIKHENLNVKFSMITFDGHLVSSNIPQIPTLQLYNYFARNKNWKRLATFKREPSTEGCYYARLFPYPDKGYVYGLSGDEIFTPTVYLEGIPDYKLVVWVSGSLQLILLMDNQEYSSEYLEILGEKVDFSCELLFQTIQPQHIRASIQEDGYRFLYYNAMNFAIKKSSKLTSIEDSLYLLISSISAQINTGTDADSMVKSIIKTPSVWLFAIRVLDSREIYVTLPASSASVQKVEEEVTRFINHYFHNIYTGV